MIGKFNGCFLMLRYYKNLRSNNGLREIEERKQRIISSPNSLSRYYCELALHHRCIIYTSMVSDFFRIVITRWRLSNHRLHVETGRYTKPKTPRKDRVCSLCMVLEDENHVIYDCPRYDELRSRFQHLIDDRNIKSFLNPQYDKIHDTARFLHDIEAKRRNDLML